LAIEAIMMETVVTADRDSVVDSVVQVVGADLLGLVA